MRWFTGSLGEAISSTQTNRTVFVVYIEGSTDDKSTMMSSLFEDEDIVNVLEQTHFLCVKLEAASPGYRQIVDIYRRVPIPSLFFFSHSGVPLAIVEGALCDDASEAKEYILESSKRSRRLNLIQELPRGALPESIIEERRNQVDVILSNNRLNKNKKSDGGESSNKNPEEMLKQQKLMERDAEMKKLADERDKEKREEALARKRILDQIAQDKAERAEKTKTTEPKPSPVAAALIPEKSLSSNQSRSAETRIQFKLATGESRTSLFKNTTKLSEVRDFIDQNLELPYRDYRLAMAFPRREFSSDDSKSNLMELDLVPTAVLLILPNPSKLNQYSQNWFKIVTDLVQDLLQPLYSLSTYLQGLVFGRRDGAEDSANPQSGGTRPSSAPRPTQSRTVKRSGNIYSLKDLKDDNDENNTWNGNSTQQM